jgi:hypothetical protein
LEISRHGFRTSYANGRIVLPAEPTGSGYHTFDSRNRQRLGRIDVEQASVGVITDLREGTPELALLVQMYAN